MRRCIEAIDFDELSMIADEDANTIALDRAHAMVNPTTGEVIDPFSVFK
eukprot:COSAG06_NODE_30534_length_537_cov_0.940639_2_plen_49_part_00